MIKKEEKQARKIQKSLGSRFKKKLEGIDGKDDIWLIVWLSKRYC